MIEPRVLRMSIVELLRQAAALLEVLGRITRDGGPAQAAQAVRAIADSYRAPVVADWRFEHPDERKG